MESKPIRPQYMADVTAKLVEFMEAERFRPWELNMFPDTGMAFNPFNREVGKPGREFRGANSLNLAVSRFNRNNVQDDSRWMTFGQVKAAGLSIRKGSRAETVMYWQFLESNGSGSGQSTEPVAKPVFAHVFNAGDIIGIPPIKQRLVFDAHERAERLIQATGAHIKFTSEYDSYYIPSDDRITVVDKGLMKHLDSYYRMVFEEIAHWTGHKTRLNRGIEELDRCSNEYLYEQLCAEIASAKICSSLGLRGSDKQLKAHFDGCLSLMKEDDTAIFRAARDAEVIYNTVLDFDPELRAKIESYLFDNAITAFDPHAEKSKAFDLQKIIKVELPSFVPDKPSASPIEGTNLDGPKWVGDEGKAVGILPDGSKVAVRFGNEITLLDEVIERLENHESGDDLPILLADFGCDYDESCDAIFGGDHERALQMLEIATATPGAISAVNEQAKEHDIEIDFGGLQLSGDAKTYVVLNEAQPQKIEDEIGLDGLVIDGALVSGNGILLNAPEIEQSDDEINLNGIEIDDDYLKLEFNSPAP